MGHPSRARALSPSGPPAPRDPSPGARAGAPGHPSYHALLSEEEWQLLSDLREIADPPLRGLVLTLAQEVAAFALEPRCPEMQADGVPCADVTVACDQCRHVAGLIQALREALRR
jgi:hypothetical protein